MKIMSTATGHSTLQQKPVSPGEQFQHITVYATRTKNAVHKNLVANKIKKTLRMHKQGLMGILSEK